MIQFPLASLTPADCQHLVLTHGQNVRLHMTTPAGPLIAIFKPDVLVVMGAQSTVLGKSAGREFNSFSAISQAEPVLRFHPHRLGTIPRLAQDIPPDDADGAAALVCHMLARGLGPQGRIAHAVVRALLGLFVQQTFKNPQSCVYHPDYGFRISSTVFKQSYPLGQQRLQRAEDLVLIHGCSVPYKKVYQVAPSKQQHFLVQALDIRRILAPYSQMFNTQFMPILHDLASLSPFFVRFATQHQKLAWARELTQYAQQVGIDLENFLSSNAIALIS